VIRLRFQTVQVTGLVDRRWVQVVNAETGEPLAGVVSVQLTMDPQGTCAVLEICDVDVDVEADAEVGP
jgi:hypothetical protein